jgi:peptidoglycan/xylan/chitin deacetylase (PgdA/CDA1 family)
VITFDDGYQDNYHFAAPILAECGLTATFFVVSDLVGRRRRPWYDQLANLLGETSLHSQAREFLSSCSDIHWIEGDVPSRFPCRAVSVAKGLPPQRRRELLDLLESSAEKAGVPLEDSIMTREQLRALLAAGHEIGSHSRTHEMLPQLEDESLDLELVGSRRQLEDMLDQPVRSFCYPNGSMDHRVVQRVRAAGYAQAVTTEPGRNGFEQDPYRLKRWFIHEDRLSGPGGAASGTLLRMEILGLSDRVFARGRRRTAHA